MDYLNPTAANPANSSGDAGESVLFVRAPKLASLFSIGKTKIWQLASEGKITAHRVDGCTLFEVDEMRRYVKSLAGKQRGENEA